jgi:DNA-binding NarL/FixJ family response regulator
MFVLISARDEFIERWRLALERVDASLATFASLGAAVAAGSRQAPRLVVVDVAGVPAGWTLPDAQLSALAGHGRILLAGREFSVDAELLALGSGISGCCSPGLGQDELANVVEVVLKGGIWVSRGALPRLLGRLQGLAAKAPGAHADGHGADDFEQRWGQLTTREREIARQVGDGANNKLIARNLRISDATIKAHLTSVFQKLGVEGRLQLAVKLSGRLEKLA